MTVEGHRVTAERVAEAMQGQPVDPLAADDLQRGRRHHGPGDPPVAVGTVGGEVGGLAGGG